MAQLSTGDAAPDFELSDQHGEPVASADLAGHRTLVVLLPEGRHTGLHDAVVRAP